MLTDGSACIINAMKKYGVKRVSVVTSIGAGDSENQAPFFFKMLMYTVMKVRVKSLLGGGEKENENEREGWSSHGAPHPPITCPPTHPRTYPTHFISGH